MKENIAPKLHVVIVDFFKAYQVNCLLSQLLSQEGINISCSVIDNSVSSENSNNYNSSIMGDDRVSLSILDVNLGYSKACNYGVRDCSNFDYLVFLNPDIEIQDDLFFVKIIENFESTGGNALYGVAQRNPDNTYEKVARKFPKISTLIFKRVPFLNRISPTQVNEYLSIDCELSSDSAPQEVDWLQSSFLFTDKHTWSTLGSFNEKYYVFMADVDICVRAWKNSIRVILDRSLEVLADGKRSSQGGILGILKSKVIRIHILDAYRYFLGK